jgi:hypothetical protein
VPIPSSSRSSPNRHLRLRISSSHEADGKGSPARSREEVRHPWQVTVMVSRACRVCGSEGLIVRKQVDTGRVFAECSRCSTGFWSTDLAQSFPTADLYWERVEASIEEAQDAGWAPLAVRGQMLTTAEAPTPELVAAWYVLNRLPLERLPWFAAHWLAEGFDGELLAQLAGEHGDDPWMIKELLPQVLTELHISIPGMNHAADVAFDDLAKRCLEGSITEQAVVDMVSHVLAASDYESSIYDLPLGTLFGLDDEWEGGWGRRKEVLALQVRRACADQIAKLRPDVP